MSLVVLCGLQAEKDLLSNTGLTVLCGATARDALPHLVNSQVTALLSWGCCGGLTQSISLGQVLVAQTCHSPAGNLYDADLKWVMRLASAGLIPSPCYSAPGGGAETPVARAALAASSGASWVDDETLAVAQLAYERNLPWTAIRSPSDVWNTTTPSDTGNMTDPSGTPAIGNVLLDIFQQPSTLPGILQSAVGFGQAMDALREILVKIGPGMLA